MANYEYDQEPLRFERHVPGRVIVGAKFFIFLCVLAGLGAITLIMILAGV